MVTVLAVTLLSVLLIAAIYFFAMMVIEDILPDETKDRLRKAIGKKVEKWIDRIES